MKLNRAQALNAVKLLATTVNRWRKVDSIRARLSPARRAQMPASRWGIVTRLVDQLRSRGAVTEAIGESRQLADVVIIGGLLVLGLAATAAAVIAVSVAWPKIKREARLAEEAETRATTLWNLDRYEQRQEVAVGAEQAREFATQRAAQALPFFEPSPSPEMDSGFPASMPGAGTWGVVTDLFTGESAKLAWPVLLGTVALIGVMWAKR